MRYQDFVRAAAGVLATALFASTGAHAQAKLPEPVTMVDTAPLPASDRSSLGAVVLMEHPVLAQRADMAAMQERSAVDTQTMGAGPARILRDVMMREDLKRQRAMDAAQQPRATPK
jgi:hypothetical protein